MAESITDLDLQLELVCHLLDIAKANILDEEPLLQACSALEQLSKSILNCVGDTDFVKAIHRKYCEQNYHEFVREMLSDPCVSTDLRLIEALYATLQRILIPMRPEDLQVKVHTTDYIHFFVTCIIRDTAAFDTLTDVVIPTLYVYISEMESKETFSILKDSDFHETVAMLLDKCSSSETIVKAMKLLSCMVGKYWDYLNDVKPFVGAKIPHILLEKAKLLGNDCQFCDYFNIVMLLLTTDKTLSLELFEDGYLEKLLDVFGNKSMLGIRRSVINIIGNIALGGQQVKQLLLDKQFYTPLFSILHSMEICTAHPFLIIGCCRVLSILASEYWVKRKFVECGCIKLLLRIIYARHDNSEVQWRALDLLDSFMDVISQGFMLSSKILETVTLLLQSNKNGSVIYVATMVFLDACELDSGARKLREIGAVEALQVAIGNPGYCKKVPGLKQLGMHVLEAQNLYTLRGTLYTIPPKCPANHPSDWPPSAIKKLSVSSTLTSYAAALVLSSSSALPPLDETDYKPNTPMAPELTHSSRQQLASLGLDPDKPLFRIGRFYGNNYGHCRICNEDYPSEDLEIRPLSMTIEQYQHLVDCGWHRGGGVKMLRLRHAHNVTCCYWETRVLVKNFNQKNRKSYKKVLKRMPVDRLTVETCRSHFNREAFDLYNTYHVKRFNYCIESEYYYCEHVVDTPTTYQVIDGIEYGTFHQLYRLDGKLVAVEVVDVIPKGMVSVYMWYDVNKEIAKYSFGVYSVLKDIEMVISMSERNPKMEYYYLQGWNKHNKGLCYKSNYQPLEFYCSCIVIDWVLIREAIKQSDREVIERKVMSTSKREQNDSDDGGVQVVKKKPNENADSIEKESIIASTDEPDRRAFPLDMKRYKEEAGKELDIGNIVVCLNYVEFLYAKDLFKYYVKDESQRETLEARFKELYVSLCPELRNQLVIDMMVCGI